MPTSGFAARLNAFRAPGSDGLVAVTPADLVRRAATVEGLNEVDLNFPDHLDGSDARAMARVLADVGLGLNGFAMRYYSDPAFKLGAFTHPDEAIRRKAIDLTKAGLDALAEAGGRTMTLWLGQDGFDYPFQVDYSRLWELEIAGIAEVCAHSPDLDISIEYKPNEPRAFCLLGDLGTTLLAIREVGAKNLGVTLDFAHVLYAGEQPGLSAALAARSSRLLGVHLNDGYGKRDDGLMVGSVNATATVEFLYTLERIGYRGVLYFDTFPDATGLDPVAECAHNIRTVKAMQGAVARLMATNALAEALDRQDAVTGQRLVQTVLWER
ncbi:sugar phosphate isomerase/epimerase family protein [Devosia sp.]|jgi:xylose isomerase|uniref:sugar phosphate isomerase/epimerase family protein n=1 Tax=Devosia sp. TaxID=1871048 RepID=UPI0037BED71C